MIFQVRLQTAAVQDLDAAYHYAASHAPAPAARWLGRFKAALKTLEHHPERCPLAPESLKSSRQLREFLFGKRPFVFRVIFIAPKTDPDGISGPEFLALTNHACLPTAMTLSTKVLLALSCLRLLCSFGRRSSGQSIDIALAPSAVP